jgi:SAM-dependent methyltransferase
MHWYESAFDLDYLARYPHRDDDEAQRDVEAILRLLRPDPAAPLLDLCCGAGRHLLALYAAGFRRLTGVDLSISLLDEARRRFALAGSSEIELVRADMREIPFTDRFATVLSLFTSFGYFDADRENARVLRSAYGALRPGGRFLLDLMNRDWVLAHLVAEEETEVRGSPVRVRRSFDVDRQRVEKEVTPLSVGVDARPIRESVRLFTPNEVQEMLAESGFTGVRLYGSLAGETWSPESRRMIVVATRAEAGTR